MPEFAVQSSHPDITTWVLVADSHEAHIYDFQSTLQTTPLGGANKHHYYDEKSGHGLTPVSNGILKADSIDEYDIGHDQRGTSSSSNSSAHNTYEPRGDINEELKRRFAKSIADKLHKAAMGKLFQHLVLAAPAKMIGELREYLTPDVKRMVSAELSKDLMAFHGKDLVSHLKEPLTTAAEAAASAAIAAN